MSGKGGMCFAFPPYGLCPALNGKELKNNRSGETTMIMIRSVVRPEKVDAVLAALMEAGFPAVTKMSVVGRGKQRGIKIGEITYDEIPKELLLTVVKDSDKDFVVKTVLKAARSGDKGAFGDGKIFVSPVDEVYTISSGIKENAAGEIEEVKL
jgi:nitrogen regulatory protein PII 1